MKPVISFKAEIDAGLRVEEMGFFSLGFSCLFASGYPSSKPVMMSWGGMMEHSPWAAASFPRQGTELGRMRPLWFYDIRAGPGSQQL